MRRIACNVPLTLALALAALAPGLAQAQTATIYVSKSGNDTTGNGTAAAPFATISRGEGELAPGAILEIGAGTYAEQVNIDHGGNPSQPAVIRAASGASVIIQGVRGGGSPRPATSGEALVAITTDHVTLQGIEIRHSNGTGLRISDSSNVKIINCKIHDNDRNGIEFDGSGTSITSGSLQDSEVYANVLVNSGHTSTSTPTHAVVVYLANNVQITGNTIYTNHHTGVFVAESSGVLVQNNTIRDNFVDNVYIMESSTANVARNRVYCTTGAGFDSAGFRPNGIAFEDSATSTGHQVTNNLVRNCGLSFTWLAGGTGAGMKNTVIANNTFVLGQQHGIILDGGAHAGAFFRNNLVMQSAGDMIDVGTPGTGIAFSHNAWYGGATAPVAPIAQSSDVTTDCVLANSGDAAAAATSFQIAAGSPCRDKGTAVTQVTTDYFGTARPQGAAYDIGAHELTGGVTPDARVPDARIADARVADGAVKTDGGIKTDGAAKTDGAVKTDGGVKTDGAAKTDGAGPTADGSAKTDGAAPTADGAAAKDSAAPAGDGSIGGDKGTTSSGGCSCRVGEDSASIGSMLGLLALALLLRGRRRNGR